MPGALTSVIVITAIMLYLVIRLKSMVGKPFLIENYYLKERSNNSTSTKLEYRDLTNYLDPVKYK